MKLHHNREKLNVTFRGHQDGSLEVAEGTRLTTGKRRGGSGARGRGGEGMGRAEEEKGGGAGSTIPEEPEEDEDKWSTNQKTKRQTLGSLHSV